jgi:hypothetical protein
MNQRHPLSEDLTFDKELRRKPVSNLILEGVHRMIDEFKTGRVDEDRANAGGQDIIELRMLTPGFHGGKLLDVLERLYKIPRQSNVRAAVHTELNEVRSCYVAILGWQYQFDANGIRRGSACPDGAVDEVANARTVGSETFIDTLEPDEPRQAL